MQNALSLFIKQHRFALAGLLAMAAAAPIAADNTAKDTYTWSAELVALDKEARTATVQARFVSDADVNFESLEAGDRVTLVWSGITTAAGVRRITNGAAPEDDRLTLPIEFVSTEIDNQYVRFKVPVPANDLTKLESLTPGQWITATSTYRAKTWEEAVVNLRPYTDVS
jgi:hypothetical protein